MRICFTIAPATPNGVYQPSCKKYELILKEGVSEEALMMLTRELVFALQLQFTNPEIEKSVIIDSIKASNVHQFNRAWKTAALSDFRAYVEVLRDDAKIIKQEDLLSAEACSELISVLLYHPFGYQPKTEEHPEGIEASSIVGIREIHCESESFVLAFDATAQKEKTENIVLVELLNSALDVNELLRLICASSHDEDAAPSIVLVRKGEFFKKLSIRHAFPETAENWEVAAARGIRRARDSIDEVRVFTARKPEGEHVTLQAIRHCVGICAQYFNSAGSYSTALVVSGNAARQRGCLPSCIIG